MPWVSIERRDLFLRNVENVARDGRLVANRFWHLEPIPEQPGFYRNLVCALGANGFRIFQPSRSFWNFGLSISELGKIAAVNDDALNGGASQHEAFLAVEKVCLEIEVRS